MSKLNTDDENKPFRIISWNFAKCLRNKIDFLSLIIPQIKPDACFIMEADLNSIEKINARNIEGFNLEIGNNFFTMGKSRVCCYIKEDMSFIRKMNLNLIRK